MYRMNRNQRARGEVQAANRVTNTVCVCEALSSLGRNASADDPGIKTALNIFFQDYVDSFELRTYAEKLIKRIKENCKPGLVSNFAYAPVVYASLRKLCISQFLDAVLVSDENG